MIYLDFPALVTLLVSSAITIPVFILVKKTILKNHPSAPGLTPKRILALLIVMTAFIVPAVIVYRLF